eukprot:Plantae.Rhodophyta-Purpureofilum_apyrenoidigerum.ctg20884.p1 GENE.Plantae.Rhodophyta-Purpureofilum_apyrenoidigerum.ctg20884~~Plantae.Rhodophyta-Purpureofilum_apyrenoidigerum.ctg20884.p1  ORF type:complete len:112 (+),score=10.55 Plantae.Rhodophyta-Purpureofilum_apyrenoidigerum.ctg20884:198-533(+)
MTVDPKAIFTCSRCSKQFSRNSNLKAHERLHTGEMPYVCTQGGCNKSFKWKSSLSSHMKTHGKSFPAKETLKKGAGAKRAALSAKVHAIKPPAKTAVISTTAHNSKSTSSA